MGVVTVHKLRDLAADARKQKFFMVAAQADREADELQRAQAEAAVERMPAASATTMALVPVAKRA